MGVGTFPGIFALLIGADPIWCVPWPVLDEQAPTNKPASSNVNTTSNMVIFFFILFLPFFVVNNDQLKEANRTNSM